MLEQATDQGGEARQRALADLATSSAVAVLKRWRSWVAALPLVDAAGSETTALRGLAAWYERICSDDRYASPAPSEALDVLHDMERRPSSAAGDRLAVVRWAVRVAEELSRCRSILLGGGTAEALGIAVSRLEVAMHAAMEHVPNRRS